ncbi:MAG: hypothetical protein ACPGSC_10635, partial [Granulosicoccaceae bacterium]
MKKPNSPLHIKLLHVALPLTFATIVAQAADTDVYLNQSSTVLPNVMFSIDTSGSMNARLWAPPDYNASQSYSGSFDSNRVYFSLDEAHDESGMGAELMWFSPDQMIEEALLAFPGKRVVHL